ncbi:glycerophosphodiester phosphodiesterase [Kaustia mangrovi]|uniref:glycerophosphodiester phosphodiesterase n=1 Tax=Kaustia mangrovi TaxID=2593653 RepID=A0A7S8HDS5_9HYPH|nr:glycerophosphodiester phosphodiesterase [Kaustia mangrovi]QPC45102.1 glycerophosphodiester phosphodiesterase [Kaustia mangrovi]
MIARLTKLAAAAAIGLAMLGASPAGAAEKVVIAHRGASGYLPEHTLAAKAMAHAMGADYIEQDVVLTKDGVPVVLHDHYLDTVTNVAEVYPDRAREDGRFYAIDFTLDEIKGLKATERFDRETGKAVYPGRFPLDASSFAVPTLEEELQLIQGLNKATGRTVGIYTEIKAPAFHRAEGQDISKIVVDTLAKYGYTAKSDRAYIQCFDWNETQRIRGELGYEGRLVQLIAENDWNEAPDNDYDWMKTPEAIAEIAKVADGVGPWIPQIVTGRDETGRPVLTGLVKAAHENGMEVHPYTLRADDLPDWSASLEEELAVVLFDAGADGIFTDFPDRAVMFLVRDRARRMTAAN